jgi:hypothetical protein
MKDEKENESGIACLLSHQEIRKQWPIILQPLMALEK